MYPGLFNPGYIFFIAMRKIICVFERRPEARTENGSMMKVLERRQAI